MRDPTSNSLCFVTADTYVVRFTDPGLGLYCADPGNFLEIFFDPFATATMSEDISSMPECATPVDSM